MQSVLARDIRLLADESMRVFDVPGLAVARTVGDQSVEAFMAGTDAAGRALVTDSLFPIASVTKLAVALAILRLADANALAIDDSLARYLPDAVAAQSAVTVRHLLTHTSGLPGSYPEEEHVYTHGLDWPMIAAYCLTTPLDLPPNTRVSYSGVGYSLLAIVVERLTNQPFPRALHDVVLAPLGIEAYLGSEPPRLPAVIDVRGSLFAGTSLEFYNSAFFRSLGEPAGGLVTTTAGVLKLIRAYRQTPNGFLRPQTAVAATTNQTAGQQGGVPGWFTLPDCRWGLGPALFGAFPPWIPTSASPHSYGHAGASGCLVWYDGDADVAWAILGTRLPDNGWCNTIFPRIGAALLQMS